MLGLQGIRRSKGIRTTIAAKDSKRAGDLLDRDFTAEASNRTWVMDFTYVRTWAGFVYVAFILGALAQKIIAWNVAPTKAIELVDVPLRKALWQRGREGNPVVPGELIGHADAGSQYTSSTFTDHLADEGIRPSIGSVADAYDNALMECVIELYQTECIRTTVFHPGPCRTIGNVEYATAGWVDWYSNRRLHSTLGMMTPWSTSKPTTRLSTESRNPYRSGGEPGALQPMLLLVGASWIVIGIFPEDFNPTAHSVGALTVFLLGKVALLIVGFTSATQGRPVVRRSALILGMLGLVGMPLTAMAPGDPTGTIGVGAAERLTVFPLQIWAVVAGISMIRRPRPGSTSVTTGHEAPLSPPESRVRQTPCWPTEIGEVPPQGGASPPLVVANVDWPSDAGRPDGGTRAA